MIYARYRQAERRAKHAILSEFCLNTHSGNSASGEFAHSLNVTDIHTTWTETRAILGRARAGVIQAFDEIQAALPFRLLGTDSDKVLT